MAATARRNTSTVRYNRSASALSRADFHCSSSVIAFCLPIASCTARSMCCCSLAFCSLSSRITLSRSLMSVCRSASAFRFSADNFSVRLLTSCFNTSGNDRLICSFSLRSSSFSFSIAAYLPLPSRLASPDLILSRFSLSAASSCRFLSASSLSRIRPNCFNSFISSSMR